jgi:hypothetical protein
VEVKGKSWQRKYALLCFLIINIFHERGFDYIEECIGDYFLDAQICHD